MNGSNRRNSDSSSSSRLKVDSTAHHPLVNATTGHHQPFWTAGNIRGPPQTMPGCKRCGATKHRDAVRRSGSWLAIYRTVCCGCWYTFHIFTLFCSHFQFFVVSWWPDWSGAVLSHTLRLGRHAACCCLCMSMQLFAVKASATPMGRTSSSWACQRENPSFLRVGTPPFPLLRKSSLMGGGVYCTVLYEYVLTTMRRQK
jgi:hypothetical protein